jgi:hypothetical protein
MRHSAAEFNEINSPLTAWVPLRTLCGERGSAGLNATSPLVTGRGVLIAERLALEPGDDVDTPIGRPSALRMGHLATHRA